MKQHKKAAFGRGLFDGIPIALGYLSVSFGFGIAADASGLSPLAAALISFTNLTSAGQVAGLAIIMTGGSMIEMALTQLVINARYFLMSLSLSQRLDAGFSLRHRLLAAFGITDEIFGVASAKNEPLVPRYLYGLILLPMLGWTTGTLLGSLAGHILPESIKLALGIAIYGMFVAIVVPAARASYGTLLGVLLAVGVSCLLAYVPFFSFITEGFAIIIAALIAAALAAWLFPLPEEEVTSP